ncbi:hypothetical protein ACSBYH_004409 [Vibrio parahaemolyticus]
MFEIIKRIFMCKKIRFFDQGGNKYVLKSGLDAYGVKQGNEVCAFERLSINGSTLVVDHFAITSYEKGTSEGQGEACLRSFADLVSTQNPNINTIEFILCSTPTYVKDEPVTLQKIADARRSLLSKIGAANISMNRLNKTCIEVRGTWLKQRWK